MRILGVKSHKAHLQRIRGSQMTREVGKAIFVASDMLKVEAQISITTGAISGKGHVASLPGEPPNNDTGDLADKITNEQTGPLKAETSSNSDHAGIEVGNSKVSARPYMKPAADKVRKPAEQLVRAAVKRVVSGGTL